MNIALLLASAGYLISFVSSYLTLEREGLIVGPIQALTNNVLGIIVSVALIALIAYGRNWARIVFMVFLAGSVFPTLLRSIGLFGPGVEPASQALSLVAIVLTAAAAILLLLPESNEWFRMMSSAAGRVGLPVSDGDAAAWFYMEGKSQVGPIAEGDLRGMLRMGELDLETHVWTDGMTDWEMAGLALPRFGNQAASD